MIFCHNFLSGSPDIPLYPGGTSSTPARPEYARVPRTTPLLSHTVPEMYICQPLCEAQAVHARTPCRGHKPSPRARTAVLPALSPDLPRVLQTVLCSDMRMPPAPSVHAVPQPACSSESFPVYTFGSHICCKAPTLSNGFPAASPDAPAWRYSRPIPLSDTVLPGNAGCSGILSDTGRSLLP